MDYKQRYAILASNKAKIRKAFPTITDDCGIYILTREEDGIKYAYIGQSLHVWTRLAEHLAGYQHIDLSLKKHGFYSVDNPTGYNVWQIFCAKDKLDEKERRRSVAKSYDGKSGRGQARHRRKAEPWLL